MTTEERDAGKIKIESDVVSMIAGLAAVDTEGVANMSSGITEEITKRVSGKNISKGIRVEVGEKETAIDVRITVKYGYKLHEVAKNLQQNVKEAVESMTGLKVVEVNVYIEGVEIKKDQSSHVEDELTRVK
ncbi:MAG: Asp23/Gls24 family envelope stress response protein [Vulcanibacillus sp.]